MRNSSSMNFALPVLDDPGGLLVLPSDPDGGRSSLEPMYVELDYWRMVDEFGLIDTGWSDAEVIDLLQRVVDIWWAEARILLRVRRLDALNRVLLPRANGLAYAAYLEYTPPGFNFSDPHEVHPMHRRDWFEGGFPELVRERRARLRRELNGVFGVPLGDALLDPTVRPETLGRFVTCWPLCATPWAVLNTLAVFPFSNFAYMNGRGGRYNGIRMRARHCRSAPRRELWGAPVVCARFAGKFAKLDPRGVPVNLHTFVCTSMSILFDLYVKVWRV